MRPIVLYSRVSTSIQDWKSQIEDLTIWSKSNNFKVVKEFGETVTGYDPEAERAVYEEMKEYLISNNVKDLGVWEISRLSRSMTKLVNEIDWFTKNNINIHFKKEGIDSISDNVTNKLLLTILGAVGQMERDTIVSRSKRGMMSAFLKGKPVFYSTNPYGYETDKNGILVIEEKEAKIIRLVFDWAIQGKTLYMMAQELNAMKVPTRLNLKGRTRNYKDGSKGTPKWTSVTVAKLLKRELYKGVRRYKDVTITMPAIVSEEVWEAVQQRFKDNIGYLNNTKHLYLFKSKIRCGICKRMITTHKMKRNDTSYYECEGHKKVNNPCPYTYSSLSTFIVDTYLFDVLFNHKYIKQIMYREASPMVEKEQKLQEIDYYNTEISVLEMKSKRLKKLYTEGYTEFEDFTKEVSSNNNTIKDLKNKINLIEAEINKLSETDINSIIKMYKDSDNYEMKRDFVVKYVNSILMYKVDLANVKWETPLFKDEKIMYFEIYAFNFKIPLKVLITPHTKNVIVSQYLNFMPDFNMVVDISLKKR